MVHNRKQLKQYLFSEKSLYRLCTGLHLGCEKRMQKGDEQDGIKTKKKRKEKKTVNLEVAREPALKGASKQRQS